MRGINIFYVTLEEDGRGYSREYPQLIERIMEPEASNDDDFREHERIKFCGYS